MIKAVFFDFGGVIAEEGWENGLRHIADFHYFDPDGFFADACDVLWSTGYMYGRASEDDFWHGISQRYEFEMTQNDMRRVIFDRFRIRPYMLELIKEIGSNGFRLAILSDQTNWLDDINSEHGFFDLFEKVYNSYHLGKGKKDETVFPEVCADFGVKPEESLFVDDNAGHIERAVKKGMKTVHFDEPKLKIKVIKELLNIKE